MPEPRLVVPGMVAEIEKGGALDAAICALQPQGLVDADALAA